MYDTNDIYHHGVSGMKWGKRNGPPYPLDAQGKADLREQKKLDAKSKEDYKMHKAYNKQRAHKAVKRDVALAMIGSGAIGTVVAGPMGGLASMLASGLATTAFSSAVNAGRNAVNNSKYKKMLLDSQEVKSASEKGKAIIENANSNVHDSNGTSIKNQVSQARKTNKYDMEFLERNLDLDADGKPLKGQELDAAYEKYLRNKSKSASEKGKTVAEQSKNVSKDSLSQTWDNIPKNASFNEYWNKYLGTDPAKARAADEEMYELMKMEYDEFKRYKQTGNSEY